MAKTAVATEEPRWKCPDCQGWVLSTVECHYCHATVVITTPVPVYPQPWVSPTIHPYTWWPNTITCGTGTSTVGTVTVNAA